jgi:hypothetical protein
LGIRIPIGDDTSCYRTIKVVRKSVDLNNIVTWLIASRDPEASYENKYHTQDNVGKHVALVEMFSRIHQQIKICTPQMFIFKFTSFLPVSYNPDRCHERILPRYGLQYTIPPVPTDYAHREFFSHTMHR